jgi:competence protein ComEC
LGLGWITAAVLAGQLVVTSPWPRAAATLVTVGSGLLVVGLALGPRRGRRGEGWGPVVAGVLAAGSFGAATAGLQLSAPPGAHQVAGLSLPWRGRIAGEVCEEPLRRDGRTHLVVQTRWRERGGQRQPLHGLVRLTVRGSLPDVRLGDGLVAPLTLRAPRNFATPGAFDVVGHLARRGIHATGFVWRTQDVHAERRASWGLRRAVANWRATVAARITATVPARRGAVLQALVVGERGAVDDDLRAAFAHVGMAHVLAISGLHVAIVAWGVAVVMRALLGRWAWLVLRVDVEALGQGIALVPVGVYCVLGGAAVSALRAGLMVGIGSLAILAGRRAGTGPRLTLAALVLACAWPGVVHEISFQLSFAAVLGIWLAWRRWMAGDRRVGRVRAALLVSTAAAVATAPLGAAYFGTVSLVGPLVNPVAVPLFGTLPVAFGLLGALATPIPALSVGLFRLAGVALMPGVWLVEALARVPGLSVTVPAPTPVELGLVYALLATVFVVPSPLRTGAGLVLAVALATDAAWWLRERFAPGRLRVSFLDVGQGDAAVAELPDGRVLVIDAGGFPGSRFDVGRAVVGPFLRTRKIRRIDALVMSHAHPDHFGGMAFLIRHFRPRAFWWPGVPGRGEAWDRLWDAVHATGVEARVLARGQRPPGFENVVEVLHPPARWVGATVNDASLVLRLSHAGRSVLLAGDVERRGELAMLSAGDLHATILKVPHHGSRTSSAVAWVHAVGAEVAAMSVGFDNRYGHPHALVEARYRHHGACVLRTDRCGTIVVRLGGRASRVEATRPGCGCPPPDSGLRGQPLAQGVHDQPDPIAHAEFLEDVGEMGLHGTLADRKRGADLLVLVAGRHQAHDLQLPLGEPVLVAQ